MIPTAPAEPHGSAEPRSILPLVLVMLPWWGALACLWLYLAIDITFGIVVLGWGIFFGCYYASRRLHFLSRWKSTTNGGGNPDKVSIWEFLSRPYITACVRGAGIRFGENVWYFIATLPYYLIGLTTVALLVFGIITVIIDLVQ